ncbi:hypothetical protein BMS3Abin16_00437 [archaeon BMS3Abin16]|nr:hypothetical protein BMS3Abin16_00437 [archaeon BMS3Abin16]
MVYNKLGVIIGLIGAFYLVTNKIFNPRRSQKRTKFITKLTGIGKDPFAEYDRLLGTIGFIFIIIGVIFQVI